VDDPSQKPRVFSTNLDREFVANHMRVAPSTLGTAGNCGTPRYKTFYFMLKTNPNWIGHTIRVTGFSQHSTNVVIIDQKQL
jgi:hypothetical protein